MVEFIVPRWPAPGRVRALQTTRRGGVSTGRYRSLNLGARTGDEPRRVAVNQRRLRQAAALPGPVNWLRQVHGRGVVRADAPARGTGGPEADAAAACTEGAVCAVLTADCLPVLLCSRDGASVAAAHAGWRGLAAGVLEATVAAMGPPPEAIRAWLGPAIGPDAFEVGPEVRSAFVNRDGEAARAFRFFPDHGTYYADLYRLARRALRRAGLPAGAIHGGGWCTFSDPARFFSHRRDGVCGRMASLIWLDGH